MSTNYYLEVDPHNCGECGRPRNETLIHIGKWPRTTRFLWQGYAAVESPTDYALETAAMWHAYLEHALANGGHLRDEHYQPVTINQLFEIVEKLRPLARNPHAKCVGTEDFLYGKWF